MTGRAAGGSPGDDLLARIAAYGLQPDDSAPSNAAMDDTAWQDFLPRVYREKLSGLLHAAIRAGDVPATSEQAAAVERLHMQVTTNTLFLEQHMLTAMGALEQHGCGPRVLKGPVMAQRAYRSAGQRPFRDIDILVPDAQFMPAVKVLTEAGYRRWLPELRPGFDARFAKTVLMFDVHGRQIDLHRTLVRGPFGLLIDLDDLIGEPDEIVVAGRRIRALGRSQRFLNACYHAALGDVPPRLLALRDVAQMLRFEDVDQQQVLHLAQRWHGLAVVQRAVQVTAQYLGSLSPHPLAEWAERYRPTRAERMFMMAYVNPRAEAALKPLLSAWVIKGLRPKFDYLFGLALPSRPFIEYRGLTPASWLNPRARRRAAMRVPSFDVPSGPPGEDS